MGRPSVSEAPRGPSAHSEQEGPLGSAAPEVPALDLPPRLRLRAVRDGELTLAGWWPPAAPLLLCPLLLVISSLSWLSPAPMNGERLLVSALGWSATLLLAWHCRPRRARLRLRPNSRQLVIGSERAGHVVALPGTLRWRLTVEHVPELPQPRYRALLLRAGRSWPLLGNTDPAELLRDLGRVLARWPGTVEHDWPLPPEAQPWSFASAAASPGAADLSPEQGVRVLAGSRADRGLRWAMVAMTALVMLDLGYLVASASAQVEYVHPLSVGLAGLASACLCAISASVITRHPRLALGSELAQEHSIFGLRWVLHRVPAQSVRGVYVLSSSAQRAHLLVDSSAGALSLLVDERDAEALRQELLQSLRQPVGRASESAASALRRWQSG